MSKTPRVRLRDKELKPESSTLESYWRGLKIILGVFNPVVAVFSFVFTLILVRFKWAKWALLIGVAVSLFSIMAGGFRSYFLWARELNTYVQVAGLTNITSFASSSLSTWLFSQVWFGVPLSIVIAGVIALGRNRYKPEWREKGTPQRSVKKIEIVNKKMKLWANVKPVGDIDQLAVRLGSVEETLDPFDIPLSALRLHTFIAGPSGFGKTTTILELVKGLILAPAAAPFKIGTVFITMKPEKDITAALEAIAVTSGRKIHIVTEDGTGATTTYNPLRHGTAAMRRNTIIDAEANAVNGGFSEAHFLRSGSRFTLLALRVLETAAKQGKTYTRSRKRHYWRVDLAHLAKIMRLGVLHDLKDEIDEPDLAADIESYLQEVEEDDQVADGVSGMRNRIANVAEGAAGKVLIEEENGLDLREAIKGGDIVIFNLNAAKDLEAAQYIANLAISDYTAALADLAEENWHLEDATAVQNRLNFIIVDEFSALGGTGLVDVVERSRSYGGAALLSTQSYSALEEVGKGFKDRLMTNTMVKLFHQIDVKADELADMLGTRQAMKETFQTFEDKDLLGSQTRASGQGTVREVEVFNLHPNTLRKLVPGEVVAVVKSPRMVEKVKVRKTDLPQLAESKQANILPSPVPAVQQMEQKTEWVETVAVQQLASEHENQDSWEQLLTGKATHEPQLDDMDLPFDDEEDAMTMPFN